MKNIIIFTFLMILAGNQIFAKNIVGNDAEFGDRNIYFASCWSMGAVTVSDNESTLISGKYSLRTNQITSSSTDATWIKSPWTIMEAGTISFTTRLDGNSGGNREIELQYIAFDSENEVTGEGTKVKIGTFEFPKPINKQTNVHEVSFDVPREIIGKTVKVYFSFTGTGGTARAGMDDILISGTYTSDPSAKCFPAIKVVDQDGDGVADDEDAYPQDPTRAFDNYLPSQKFGTLMFEDLWPATGDYDFNDLVVDYRINRVTDAKGEVVEIITELYTKAAGAGFRNGLGIAFTGVSPEKVIKVEGTKTGSSSIHAFAENGLEAGTEYLTYIPFDNVQNVLKHVGGGALGINTDPNFPLQKPILQKIVVTLKQDGKAASGSGINLNDVGMHNFNPFLIINQNRGMEVHLPGKPPTSLADQSYFGTKEDGSTEGGDSYYRSKENGLPWAMNVTEQIPYPSNKIEINKGYLKFFDWVLSGGTAYPDWYLDLPGYRNNEVLLDVK